MRPVPVGTERTERRVVAAAETAQALGNPGVDVLASAFCLLYAEQAARRAVDPWLEPGEGMAGVRFAFRHVAPAPPGTAVTVHVRVTAARRRFLTFAFRLAGAGGELLAEGEMLQAVLDLARLPAAAPPEP